MVVCCSSRCSVLKVLVALYMLWFLIFISEADPRSYVCPNTTTYTPNSTYQINLNSLLSTLSSPDITRNNLFYNATAGNSAPDRAYGFFMCRGDVTFDACHDCVETAIREIVEKCPKEKNVRAFYDECMLRYENQSFFSTMDTSMLVYIVNPGNVSEPDRFAQLLGNTMNDLATRASSDESGNGGRLRGFETEEANFTSFQNLYSLVQCTPDLSGFDCNRCLRAAIAFLPTCCGGRQGAWVFYPSCNIRYDTSPFYNNIAAPPPPSPTPTIPPPPAPESSTSPGGNGRSSAQVIIPIFVAVVVAIFLFTLICFFFLRRRAKKYDAIDETTGTDGNDISAIESLQYDLSTIAAATNNFSAENKIGEGGFGAVFKGKLSNGQEIAVKRLSKTSRQGAQEFKNEVVLVSKLQHRNLVRLVGFCLEREEKILIYEFVPNKSLDHFLFDSERQQLLDWVTRYKIIRGIALGMLYLHEDSRLRIIHRDLKASNILLDKDMNPKISDFGMAKLFDIDQSQGNTNRIAGTFGYMSPEYAMHGEFSVKSDVFSFGVLLLEIVSGKKNNSSAQSGELKDLLSHAWKLWKDGTPLDLVDPALRDSFIRNEVIRCIHIGLLCVQEDAEERPTIASVVVMFNSSTLTLALPHQPAFYFRSRTDAMVKPLESDESSTKSIPMSANEVSITELYPR